MPIQSVAEENRAIGRHIRNVRRTADRIRPRAIRRRWRAAVPGPLPVATGVTPARPPEAPA